MTSGRQEERSKPRSAQTTGLALVGLALVVLVIAAVIIASRSTNDDLVSPATAEAPSTTAQTTASSPTTTATTAPTTAPETTEPPAPSQLEGDWSTEGATIVDARGELVEIRGINWFGFDSDVGSPHGLWARDLRSMIDQIADLGFNTIRLPFSSAMLDEGAEATGIDESLNPDLVGLTSLELMDIVIDYAGTRGLAVILDRHALAPNNRHHLWYDADFPAERFITDWELLARRYGDSENVIGADLYNEPHDEACWGCGDPAVDWKLAAQEAGDAVHAIDPGWLLFIEGVAQVDGDTCDPDIVTDCTWWGGNLSDALTEPIEVAVANQVVYSPHEYATSVSRPQWFDDPAFPDNMVPIWNEFWGEIETSNTAPVVVGEFGTTLDSEIDAIWLDELLIYMDGIGADWLFWSFNPNSGDTGGILEDDWATVDEEKLGFLQPYLTGPFDPLPG